MLSFINSALAFHILVLIWNFWFFGGAFSGLVSEDRRVTMVRQGRPTVEIRLGAEDVPVVVVGVGSEFADG